MKVVQFLPRLAPIALTLGLVIGSTMTPVWGAEAPTAATASAPSDEKGWVDNRVSSVVLGAVGGVLAYTLYCRWWGGGAGARMVQQGVLAPGAAAGAGVGGGRLMLATSGVVGALVGDWWYRSKQVNSAASK
ncbi:hypothetical protein CCP4SC76_7760012 [Gammaproteobacteria bacterium]